jgi:putative transposase
VEDDPGDLGGSAAGRDGHLDGRTRQLRVRAGAGGRPEQLAAVSESAALEAFVAFTDTWGDRYPAIIKLWDSASAEFVPFLHDNSIRSVVCTTNAIESINARIRRAVNARGHFPTEAAALKCVYLAIMSLDPTGRGRKRWTNRWKEALNAFDITFDGRPSAGRK